MSTEIANKLDSLKKTRHGLIRQLRTRLFFRKKLLQEIARLEREIVSLRLKVTFGNQIPAWY